MNNNKKITTSQLYIGLLVISPLPMIFKTISMDIEQIK